MLIPELIAGEGGRVDGMACQLEVSWMETASGSPPHA